MTGYRVSQHLLLACIAYFMVACEPGYDVTAHQSVLEWPEQHLLFVADTRQGKVQSFFLGNGAPVPFAQTHDPQRSSVRDLQLDPQRGQLWVLGDNGVSVHKARGLVLQRHITLDTANVAALSVDETYVWLVDGAGERIGQIDRGTLVASWRFPDRHG